MLGHVGSSLHLTPRSKVCGRVGVGVGGNALSLELSYIKLKNGLF